jgi:hypothetical protein
MKKVSVLFSLVLLVVGLLLLAKTGFLHEQKLLVIGTANPGLIKIYKPEKGTFREIKKINSGYKYVWTVRVGDIHNNGKKYLIAGVSDSLYGTSFNCRVVGYDLEKYQKFEIDEVDSFRCKDLTIGDADNDGDNDIVLVTHGKGLIRMAKGRSGRELHCGSG